MSAILESQQPDSVVVEPGSDAMALLAAIEMQDDDPKVRLRRASGAKAFVGEKARLIGQEAIQLHGGIGVTDELNVSHYFKRIATINALLGDPDFHLQRYSAMMDTLDEF